MKSEVAAVSLSIAACMFFLCPQFARAGSSTQPTQTSNDMTMQAAAKQEAMEMVAANANLVKTIDANKIQPGYKIEARLDGAVNLTNGPELPRGALLVGRVTADQMRSGGPSRMAVRFTQAQLKNGKVIPIKATIVSISRPEYASGINIANMSSVWTHHTLRVDQIGVLSGVDMHSNVASSNSGMFIAPKKDNMKLDAGSQLGLAIAQRNSQQNGNQQNGGA